MPHQQKAISMEHHTSTTKMRDGLELEDLAWSVQDLISAPVWAMICLTDEPLGPASQHGVSVTSWLYPSHGQSLLTKIMPSRGLASATSESNCWLVSQIADLLLSSADPTCTQLIEAWDGAMCQCAFKHVGHAVWGSAAGMQMNDPRQCLRLEWLWGKGRWCMAAKLTNDEACCQEGDTQHSSPASHRSVRGSKKQKARAC